jgi:hypothetical protein
VVGEAPAHRAGDGEIFRQRRVAEPELDGAKSAFKEKIRLVGCGLRRHQPEPA